MRLEIGGVKEKGTVIELRDESALNCSGKSKMSISRMQLLQI